MSLAAHTPLLAAMAREVRRVAGSPLQVMLMVVLPFASAWWLLAIFAEPLPRDLPLALVDLDRSQASSTVARMLDDTPTIRVSVEAPSIADAERLVRTGAVYGLVAFPAGFGSAAVRGEAPAVSVFYNTQWLLAASLVARDAQAAVLTASAGAELGAQQAHGVPRPARAPRIEPIVTRTHTLVNPQLNYHYYLLAALFPAVLQMFAAMAMAIALGAEFKDDAAPEWLAIARGSLVRAMAAKLAVQSAWFTMLAIAMLAIVFGRLGTPLTGRVAVLVAGAWLFVTAVQAVACALVALTAGLRLAASLVAFYTGIAFPFIGVTFPMLAMPPLARAWAECLPLTHFVRVLTDHGLRGPQPGHDLRNLTMLAVFIAGALLVMAWPLHRLARGHRAWNAS